MLRLGLRIASRPRAFAPDALFVGGGAAMWIDPADLATMFQDAAGTVPAAVDAPVGRILDKSGRGNHATQSVAGSRPILRRAADGRHALEFDGVDDFLVHGFGIAGGDVTLSCAAQRGAVAAGDVGLFTATPTFARLQAGIWAQTVAPHWGSYAGGAYRSAGHDLSTRAVVSVIGRATPDTQRLLTNNGGAIEYATSYAGDNGDRRAIGREFTNMSRGHFAGRLYALTGVGRALSDAELAQLVRHQAAQAGVET